MKILIIKMSSIGDIVHTFPALLDSKKYIPDLTIDWLVDENFIDVIKLLQYNRPSIIEKIVAVPLRKIKKHGFINIINFRLKYFWGLLRQDKYDLVIDAQGLLKSAIMAKLVRANKIIGFDRDSARESWASCFYHEKISVSKNLHAIVRMRQLFAKILNYNFAEVDLIFKRNFFPQLTELKSKNIENYIVFLHGTTWETKRWSAKYWQRLAELMVRKNISIVVMTSNQEEQQFADELLIHNPNIIILSNLTIMQVASVLSNAMGAVAVDTGFAHLASVMGVPVVGIYAATSMIKVGVLGDNCNNIQSKYHCSPCLSRVCLEYNAHFSTIKQPCLQEITPEIVLAKLEEIMC